VRGYFIFTLTIMGLIFFGCSKKRVDRTLEIDNIDQTGLLENNGRDATLINRGYENVDRYGGFADNKEKEYGYESNREQNYNSNRENRLENIYFDIDKYAITPEKLPTVINNAKIIKEATISGAKVKIEGHCDMRGSDEYNYALGLKRAKSTKDALISRGGISPSKIIIVSYGESSPLCTTDYSNRCLSENRRAQFKIIE